MASNLSPFHDPLNARLYEPRIELVKRQLESLLAVVDLEHEGGTVEVDGFRLKDPSQWLVPSSGDPIEVFGYAGARCNVDCVFCYNKGNPPELALGNRRRPAADEHVEMLTRLCHYHPEAGRALFPALGDLYEVLAHPRVLSVLRLLREKTDRLFRISTSGRLLTRGVVARLAELRPIYLHLSLNSASPQRLRDLMRTPAPEVHLEAPALLREYGIPYAAVIVPWPEPTIDAMLEDLEATIAFADQYQPHIIEIHLPGYTRYFSREELFDHDAVWSGIVSRVRELRPRSASPVVAMPTMYEETRFEEGLNAPRVIGLVANSPAARAGLLDGDEVRAVGAVAVRNRPQARDLLCLAARSNGGGGVPLLARRNGHEVALEIDPADFAYPYAPEADRHLGVVTMGSGFRTGHIERLRELIGARGARHVLFLSSLLVKPYFEQALRESPLLDTNRVRLDVEVPANRFFGGNIILGDLLVVQDFIDGIRDYLARGQPRPDLVVIPSSPFSLGAWKRDLTGRVYLDIERETGVPVELLECETIYD